MRPDFAVIGAGISGLTAALILAKNGRRVILVEKAARTAPLLSGFTREGAFFDTGFHYAGGLGPGQILDRLLRYLGLAGHLETVPYDEDCFDRLSCPRPRFEFRFPYGLDKIRRRLLESFPREEAAVDGYLEAVDRAFNDFPYLNPDREFDPKHVLERLDGESLQSVLDGLTADPLLKRILSVHCFLYGVPPSEFPFDLHSCIVGSYYQEVSGLAGGGLSLARAFNLGLERQGVEVILGRGVKRILCPDRSVSGVELEDGEVVACGGAVATCHPASLPALVPRGAFSRAYENRLAGLGETVSAYALFAACDLPAGEEKPFNRYLLPGMDDPILGVEAPLERRLLYIIFHRRGPGEKSDSLTALCPAAPGETERWRGSRHGRRPPDYERHKEEVAGAMRGRLEAACPELAGRVRPLALATPLTFRDYSHSPLGSLYGAAHRVGRRNPAPPTRVKGLYLSGQATAAPGLAGAMLSGFLTCGFILGHEHLREEVRRCN